MFSTSQLVFPADYTSKLKSSFAHTLFAAAPLRGVFCQDTDREIEELKEDKECEPVSGPAASEKSG